MHERALEHFAILQRLSGDGPLATAEIAHCYDVSGRGQEARALLQELEGRARHQYVSAASIAEVYIGLGELERALDWLQKAVQERALALAAIHVSPRYDPLRGDARFEKLAQAIGRSSQSGRPFSTPGRVLNWIRPHVLSDLRAAIRCLSQSQHPLHVIRRLAREVPSEQRRGNQAGGVELLHELPQREAVA